MGNWASRTATTIDPTGSEETKWGTGLVRKVRASGRASGTKKKKKTSGEVTRKCSLPPAPPTAGQPKAGGLTTCWGRRRGGSPRKAHESATTPKPSPPAGDLGRGAPAPTAPHPGAPEKGAVEELERSDQDAACARGAEPRAWDPNCRLRRHPRSLQAPGRVAPGLARARRSASKEPRLRAPRGGSEGSASGAVAVPSRLTPRRSVQAAPSVPTLRETLPMVRVHPRHRSRPHPRPEVDTASPRHSQLQPALPQTAPAALDTGNSWVLDSGSPRPPSSVNSACFSTKWRPRSRAHVAAFPLPVPISSFAARRWRDGPSASQWPHAVRQGCPINARYPRI